MKKKLTYSTPEGYFDTLSARLMEIPAATPQKNLLRKAGPFLAMAACTAAGLVAGYTLRKPVVETDFQDDIIAYLIDTGTTLAQIENTFEL